MTTAAGRYYETAGTESAARASEHTLVRPVLRPPPRMIHSQPRSQRGRGVHLKSNIEIAQAAKMQRIDAIAKERLGIDADHLEGYGRYKAKLSLDYIESLN